MALTRAERAKAQQLTAAILLGLQRLAYLCRTDDDLCDLVRAAMPILACVETRTMRYQSRGGPHDRA